MELIHAINEWAAAIGMRQVEVGDAERLDREGALSLLEASLLGAGTGGAAFVGTKGSDPFDAK